MREFCMDKGKNITCFICKRQFQQMDEYLWCTPCKIASTPEVLSWWERCFDTRKYKCRCGQLRNWNDICYDCSADKQGLHMGTCLTCKRHTCIYTKTRNWEVVGHCVICVKFGFITKK